VVDECGPNPVVLRVRQFPAVHRPGADHGQRDAGARQRI
jgi:hypothetical protein